MAQLTATVGKEMKRLRETAGRRQEDVAAAARACGLGWGRSTVAMLEAGRYELKAAELLVLPAVLRLAKAGDTSIGGLLGNGDELVELTPVLSATPEELRRGPGRKWPEMRAAFGDDVADIGLFEKREDGGIDYVGRTFLVAGEAERKAARSLGIPAADLVALAHELWGRHLSAQRDALVAKEAPPGTAPRTLQALRSHTTRRLLAELGAEHKRRTEAMEAAAERLAGRRPGAVVRPKKET